MRTTEIERLYVEPTYVTTARHGRVEVTVRLYGPVDDARIEREEKSAARRAAQLDV